MKNTMNLFENSPQCYLSVIASSNKEKLKNFALNLIDSNSNVLKLNLNSNIDKIEIRDIIYKNYKDNDFKIVYIDLLYLSNYIAKDTKNLHVFNDISSMLARTSIELNIKTIVTLHLPNIENNNPKLHDLMIYGSFLQVADIVGFLCDKLNSENKIDTELIVAKHRGGDLFNIMYRYNSELKTYKEL